MHSLTDAASCFPLFGWMGGSSLTGGRTPFYHAVTVHDCSRVKGSSHTKNQLDPLRCLTTIHKRYSSQTDRQMDLLWHRPNIDSRPKKENATQKWKCSFIAVRYPRLGPIGMYAECKCLRCSAVLIVPIQTRCAPDT